MAHNDLWKPAGNRGKSITLSPSAIADFAAERGLGVSPDVGQSETPDGEENKKKERSTAPQNTPS